MAPPREIETAKPLNVEWPTMALIVTMYVLLALLMWFFTRLPWWVASPIGAYLIALHGSLQHEALHGHPTRNRLVNELLVSINPSLWFPRSETAKPLNVEWPTMALIVTMYVLLALLMWFFTRLPWWVASPIGAYLIALHGSLQHEALHGHPTRNRLVNELLVSINPSLWFP